MFLVKCRSSKWAVYLTRFLVAGLVTKPVDEIHCFVSETDRPSRGNKETKAFDSQPL